jgi:hypothetical protein
VPQGQGLFAGRSVAENMELGRLKRRTGVGKHWHEERIFEFLPRIKQRERSPADCLSGGEKMVAVARALSGDTRVLLLGEPFEGLAPAVVEVCGSPWTSAQTRARAREILHSVGQAPIDVKREIDGFVLNRLQVALLTEAFRLVQDGVVSPEDLDRTIADGLGLRWSFMGPFETIELNAPGGVADYCTRYTPWFRRYVADLPKATVWDEPNWQRVAAQWGRAPSAGEIASKSRWRNERLAALAAHKRTQRRYRED